MTNGLKRASLTKEEWTTPGEGGTNQVARFFLLSPLLSLPHELYELVYQQALLAKGWQQLCVPRRGTPAVYVLANAQDAGMNKNDEKQFTNANKNFWHVYNVTEAQYILHIPAVNRDRYGRESRIALSIETNEAPPSSMLTYRQVSE